VSWQSNSAGSGWTVIEEQSYEIAVAQCGTYQFFDEALAPLDYALHRNPLGFEAVQGYPDIYLARTKLRLLGPEIIPSYRLWFRVFPQKREVHKLWVEIAPPEDMGLWDDDEVPF
jgi:hypothetical protein